MNVEQLKRIYFVGIGGIGMSALARFFKQRHAAVSGYDLTQTDLTRKLDSEGIEISFVDDISLIDKNAELVVYTPAIPKTNQILNWYKDNKDVYKRQDLLYSFLYRPSKCEAYYVVGTYWNSRNYNIYCCISCLLYTSRCV